VKKRDRKNDGKERVEEMQAVTKQGDKAGTIEVRQNEKKKA
jgi:hypothetical protein